MKLVIFIGHFKTGSSSLQRFFCRNYVSLLNAGILYPSVESQGMSRNMAALRQGHDFGNMEVGLNISEPHNALALRLKNEEDGHDVPGYYPNLPSGFQMFENLQAQIAALSPNVVILCSEVFALFGLTAELKSIKRIANRFSQHDVTIYCNLRRPDHHISSWHRQRLKFGEKLAPLRQDAFRHYLATAHFKQDEMIQGWKDHFPNGKLVVRNFADVKSAGGSVADFMTHCGAEFPEGLENPGDFNLSVPSAFAEIGRLALHELGQERGCALVSWLIAASSYVDHVKESDVEMFGSINRELIANNFSQTHEKISEIAGVDQFYSDIESFAQQRSVSDVDAARAALPGLRAHAKNSQLAEDLISWLEDLDF
ncbi:hypothetical protein [Sulfitobacter sp. PS-8MA]|uniref:hypothetical protein n=1 Tax=Sulfitobacter sp. PS-8MA TaxID=3237707 RepID=UPI0034C60D17